MLNSLILLGRVSKDPIKNTSRDTTIVNFDIACDNVRKDTNGERGSSFFQVVCFNAVAENVAKSLHKGSKVVVKGYIQQRNFTRKDGSKGVAYEVTADSVEFLDPKPVEEEIPEADVSEVPVEEPAPAQEPAFDPYTGKPLKPAKNK